MTLYKNKYRVETTRLKVWDYANPWWYFVTINTKNHEYYFGSIVNDLMGLNKLGEKTQELWNDIPKHYPVVELDYYVIMPNHVHGIIIINKSVETRHASSLQHMKVTLSDIIGSLQIRSFQMGP
jgi:putative transposase